MSQVLGLLDVTVDLEPWTGQDQHGIGSYGAVRTVKAKVQEGAFNVSGTESQAIVASYKVILGEPILVDTRDRLTLPKEFGTRETGGAFARPQPQIRMAKPVYCQGVHDHTVVLCG